jgi:hypothetical protein
MTDERLLARLRGRGNQDTIAAADRIEALTAKLAECEARLGKAEELEAKMKAIDREILRRVKLAEEFKNAKGSGTSQRREHYRMHALSEALGAIRKIMKGKARSTLAEIEESNAP